MKTSSPNQLHEWLVWLDHLPKCVISYLAIIDNWVLDSFILTGELISKALRRFVTCLLVNDNVCGKLVSSSD